MGQRHRSDHQVGRGDTNAGPQERTPDLAELLGTARTDLIKDIELASIGPVTSATLRELQLPVAIQAREFTMGRPIRAIVLARYAAHST